MGLFDIDGFDVLKFIWKKNVMFFVLILIVWDKILDKIFGLDVGVDDYLFKLFEIEELLVRIRVFECCLSIVFYIIVSVKNVSFDIVYYMFIIDN